MAKEGSFDSNSATNIVNLFFTDPILGTIFFVGLVPILLSIIACCCCIPVNCGVCCCCKCCCPYVKYRDHHVKFEKKLKAYITKNNIPYNFNPAGKVAKKNMFDTIAEQNDVDPNSKEVKELNKMKK